MEAACHPVSLRGNQAGVHLPMNKPGLFDDYAVTIAWEAKLDKRLYHPLKKLSV
jgi:hypothetical protein